MDHKMGEWDLPFYAKQMEERGTGCYVEHIQTVVVNIGGVDRMLTLDYDRPSKYFDTSKFREHGITACVCCRMHMEDSWVGWIGIGSFIFIVREVNGRSELRCRYWVGEVNKIDDNSLCHPSFVNWFGNTSCFRYSKVPQNFAHAFWLHCNQEMECLKSFLPHYYEVSVQEGRVKERLKQASKQQSAVSQTGAFPAQGRGQDDSNSDYNDRSGVIVSELRQTKRNQGKFAGAEDEKQDEIRQQNNALALASSSSWSGNRDLSSSH